MRQTDEQKLERSIAILEELKDARGGKLLDSHRVMGNDPNLINMFLQQYVTMKVHAKIALENGATIDEIFEVIRILFFTCGVTKLLPALETLGEYFEPVDLPEK